MGGIKEPITETAIQVVTKVPCSCLVTVLTCFTLFGHDRTVVVPVLSKFHALVPFAIRFFSFILGFQV